MLCASARHSGFLSPQNGPVDPSSGEVIAA